MRLHRLILPAFVVATTVIVAPLSGGVASSEPENRDWSADSTEGNRDWQMEPTALGNRDWQEVFSPDGTITQVSVPREMETRGMLAVAEAEVVPIQQTGEASARFDVVFVGDGYTAGEMGTFHDHVMSKWNELSAVEPFKAYKQYFNVWQVNVVSAESGVDNDTGLGVDRNTPLGMRFWCQNIERLLCVDSAAANNYAALAPGQDQVIALGNATKYGGAGVSGGLATAAGGNSYAGQIVVHELGHSIGKLADEYDTPYGAYTGSDPVEANVSNRADGSKWAGYLGQPSPDGGVVGSFEGARFYKSGLYRPTENSIMRTLGKQFNLMGRDAMIAGFKAKVPELN